MPDQNWQFELEEYIKQGEPDRAEKSEAWQTAIGLQAVDGLNTSAYLLDTAKDHIEGKITIDEAQQRIHSYYEQRTTRTEIENETKEADIVSARIAKLLGEKAFQFSPAEWLSIHRRLFEGVFSHAGQIRQYNITKKEWVLNGDTVIYADWNSIKDTLDYDFATEKQFSYEGLSIDAAVKHAFFQDGNFVTVSRTAEGGVPGIAYPCRVFQCSRMLQNTAWGSTIGIELAAVLLGCNSKTDSVLCHGNGAVTDKTIKAQPRHMKDIGWVEIDWPVLHRWCIVIGLRVFVIQSAMLIPIHGHTIRHQRIQRNDLAFPISNDLGVGISPEKQVGHEGFPKHKGTHFRIWLIVEQMVQRMVEGFLFPTILLVSVQMKRQTCHRLGQNADAGIHSGHLHGTALRYSFAGGAVAQEKAVTAASGAVLGLVPGAEQPSEDTHKHHSPSKWVKEKHLL